MPTIVEGLKAPVTHACIPLRFEGERRGVLNVAARPDEQFSDDELRLLETLGHQISVAIERARHLRTARLAYEELQQAQVRVIETEKMAVVGTFASGLAHEVRNPLNSMSLQLVILERRLAALGEKGGEMSRVTAIIREEIDRLNRLVDDFLMFSRTNRIHFQPASLDAVVDDVMHLLRPEARGQGVILRRQQLGDPLPLLRMDVEKMKQVVINLVKNAMEAMPGGGSVVVESGLRDGRACLIVRDTGPGLPEGVDVFQIFTTTKARGTGLGLSIAQQVVLEHGGEIRATSVPGEGAALEVTLPLAPEGKTISGEAD
jgi:signal transduction histidine kinase